MKRWPLIGAMAMMAALLIHGLTLAVASFADGWCSNTPRERAVSPDGTRAAVLFERNCGATTDFSEQVSVIGAGEKLPNSVGNVFVAQPDEHGAIAPWGGPLVELRWQDETTLLIRYDRSANVLHDAPGVRGVRIVYADIDDGR